MDAGLGRHLAMTRSLSEVCLAFFPFCKLNISIPKTSKIILYIRVGLITESNYYELGNNYH